MLINSPNISGSLTVTGNATISGSLNVAGGINATITGSATSASYVEYSNVANKPTLVSGSSQVSFNGIVDKPTLVSGSSQITYSGISSIPAGIVSGSSQISFNGIVDKPTLVSGSSQVTYSGLTGIPVGIVSSSAQVGGYGIFATTGSNQFNGSQAITGSLTVTGQVVAQTLNVQQVTSSIVFSSGSNIFGNSLSNTQQFTGSVSVTGSLIATSGLQVTANNNALGTNNTLRFTDTDTATEANQQIGRIEFFSSDVSTPGAGVKAYIGAFAADTTPDAYIAFATQDGSGTPDPVERVRISSEGNIGIGTNSPSYRLDIQGSAGNIARITDGTSHFLFYAGSGLNEIATTGPLLLTVSGSERLRITAGGNVGIGTTSPSRTFQVNGYISAFDGTTNTEIISSGGVGYFGTSTNHPLVLQTNNAERLRITAGGNVGIGTTSVNNLLQVGGTANGIIRIDGAGDNTDFGIKWASSNASIYSNTGNAYLTFATNGSERLRITSGGNVGIGTTSPTSGYKMEIVGDLLLSTASGNRSLVLTTNNANAALNTIAGTGLELATDGSNKNLAFRTGTTTAMYINSSANVGIGVTDTESYRLGIFTNQLGINFKAFYDSVNHLTILRTTYSGTSNCETQIRAYNPSNGVDADLGFLVMNTASNLNEVIRIKGSTQRVGIGTTTPSERLEVNGSLRLSDGNADGPQLKLASSGFSDWNIDNLSGNLRAYYGSTEYLRLTSGGELLVGSTSAGVGFVNALKIGSYQGYNSDSNSTAISAIRTGGFFGVDGGASSNNQASYTALTANVQWGAANNPGAIFRGYQNSNLAVQISFSGNLANTNGSYGTLASDIRLKENIKQSTSKLNDLLRLNVVNFNFIGNEEKHIGFIAQEMQEVFPSFVYQTDTREYNEEGNLVKGFEDTLGVKVGMEFAILVKAIQELKSELDAAKTEIQLLKQQ